MKLAAGRLKWKLEDYVEIRKKRPHGEIVLLPDDIKALSILQGKIDQYLDSTPVDLRHPYSLNACFRNSGENDALDYFDKQLSGKTFSDTTGEKIHIYDDSFQFMYKDDAGRHVVDGKNYVAERGKRLPYIPIVIGASRCILERPYRYDRTGTIDRMYLHAFLENYENYLDKNMVFMAVIVLRDRKKNKPTTFKTAFPIAGELDLCRRLSGGYSFVEKK